MYFEILIKYDFIIFFYLFFFEKYFKHQTFILENFYKKIMKPYFIKISKYVPKNNVKKFGGIEGAHID